MTDMRVPSDLDVYRALRACIADRDARDDKVAEASKRDDWGYVADPSFLCVEHANHRVDKTWEAMESTLYKIRLHEEEYEKMKDTYKRQQAWFHRHVASRAAMGFDDKEEAPEGEALRRIIAKMMIEDAYDTMKQIRRRLQS
jgi:hypothetical protein